MPEKKLVVDDIAPIGQLYGTIDEPSLEGSLSGDHQVVTDNYEDLKKRPRINDILVKGNHHGEYYKLLDAYNEITVHDVDELVAEAWGNGG